MKRLRSDWTPEQAAGLEPPPVLNKGPIPKTREEYIERLTLVHRDALDFTNSNFNWAQDKVMVRCTVDDRHPIFPTTSDNLLRDRSCPICKVSSGEREIVLWLEGHGITFEREWRDHGIGSENPRARLRFDFLIPEHRLFIEYDAQQHFQPHTFGKISESEADEEFCRIQMNDQTKNRWAQENGYEMLRIRYDESVKGKLYSHFGLTD